MRASLEDPHAFTGIFERYYGPIHRYIERRVGRTLARDLAADTFLIAFGRRERFDSARGDVLPWLFGIASNLLRDHAREERRMLRAYARTGVAPVATEEATRVEERLDAESDVRALADGLARLPRGQREALLLLAWGDLTYAQIAVALGVPVGTVRSRIARARRRLGEPFGPVGQ